MYNGYFVFVQHPARAHEPVKGIVSDIQRFSVHDGPGIRTTVFLKGCNLRCRWCHNPETLRPDPELRLLADKCIACGACFDACPRGAHVRADGRREFLRERCVACGTCAGVCYAEALVVAGREMTPAEVLDEVAQDRTFYARSGGGVTVSGGEPLMQPDFTRQILSACKAEGFHTAIQTNLAWPPDRLATVLPVTDLVMADIKTINAARHAEWTGQTNEQVLANARRLSAEGVALIVRTPVVPGLNDTPEQIGQIAGFLAELPALLYYELLPYHPLGTGKYESLGLPNAMTGARPPTAATMRSLLAAAKKKGKRVEVRG